MFIGSERHIKVLRSELLVSLHVTLDNHLEEVAKATKVWEEAVIEFTTDLTARVMDGDYTSLSFGIPKPNDSSKEIERAIRMIEMSSEEEITLDEKTFNQWVMGEWSFRSQLNEIGMMASAMVGSLRKKV